jgi:ATP-dependent helicase/nuclease subunit B
MGDLRADAPAGVAAAADASAVAEIDVWLRGGGLVVAASERAARALTAAFHRARRVEGLAGWPAPAIRDWHGFVRDAWQENGRDDRLILNGMQEQELWADIVGASGRGGTLLEGPRQRMAALAMQAHGLLCAYAPRFLNAKARSAWQQDAGAFSGWLAGFEAACDSSDALSATRVPLELLRILEAERSERAPLLLAGFDRLLPAQRAVFDAWGKWSEARPGEPAAQAEFYEAPDAQTELAACALWCERKLAENPHTRLLVVTQNLAQRRGEIERALLGHGSDAVPRFEFSLGVPLSSVRLPRGAQLVLRWISGALEEREIDWLFSTGQTTSGDAEGFALTGFMRALRRSGRQRVRWGLAAFLAQRTNTELPRAWVVRMLEAKRRLEEFARSTQTPLAWAELAPVLLQTAGWPHPEGSRQPLASAEFQALRRWQQVVDECASLGFDGRRMSWSDFLGALGRALEETLFAPESRDAPIQIAGPAESAGLTADAIWVLGASDDTWPASGSMHPLLPVEVQREAAMPHASPQLDWELARSVSARLLSSAREVNFSYARQSEGVEMRGSRLVAEFCGAPQPLPVELAMPDAPVSIAVPFDDVSCVSLRAGDAAGGSTILTAQSECPFKAFAMGRLDAQGWEPAQAGLAAAQRGQLLHSVLHAVWGGPPAGLRTHAELLALADLQAFVESHVLRVMEEKMPAGVREQMPQRYLQLEAVRLTNLVTEWLEFERERVEFSVARTELDVSRSIAGLTLKLRLDRIDRLSDGSLLVIDYKSGNVSPKLWEMPRPEDVQLPLYAGFGLDEELRTQIEQESCAEESENGDDTAAPLGGLVFAKVRTGGIEFAGRVGDAKATLLQRLNSASGLVKKKFTAEELMDWRDYIEDLARAFLAGAADVNPREYLKTCERCELQALCRVHENRAETVDAEEGADE